MKLCQKAFLSNLHRALFVYNPRYVAPVQFKPLPADAKDIDAMAAATKLKEAAQRASVAASEATAQADALEKAAQAKFVAAS